MVGSFVAPSASPKTRSGKANRPKRSSEAGSGIKTKPEYPITDSFASKKLPEFRERHRNTNAKSGFHSKPARPPAGRLAKRPPPPSRGSGHEHRAN